MNFAKNVTFLTHIFWKYIPPLEVRRRSGKFQYGYTWPSGWR